MNYEPEVNHYVKWDKGIEGWIYFKSEKYLTIEALVRPKNNSNYVACNLHRNERLLVLCYKNQWKELEYIKTRSDVCAE